MKIFKTDLISIANKLEKLENADLDVGSFRHNNLTIHVARDSNQKDGTWYWITKIEDVNDPNPGSYPTYPPGVR